MENDIRSFTKEMENYYLQIQKINNDFSLTNIQIEECRDSLQKEFESQGIKYRFQGDSDNVKNSNICFNPTSWYVNDVGIIQDIRSKGALPFSLTIEDNIFINYDPRRLGKIDFYERQKLNNNEFLNFRKGSEYRFIGKIIYCNYYYFAKPKAKFTFCIEGDSTQSKKCFIATACYESSDAQEVIVLRQYRDDILLKTFIGKVFVKFYYFFSPFFAMLISKSELLKNSVLKYFLQPLVTKLKKQQKER